MSVYINRNLCRIFLLLSITVNIEVLELWTGSLETLLPHAVYRCAAAVKKTVLIVRLHAWYIDIQPVVKSTVREHTLPQHAQVYKII